MAQPLLGGVLPAIYSGADQLKRGVYGLLTNPKEQAERAAQSLLQSRAERQALMGQAFANPDRPFQVTNPQALSQLGTDVLTGELGIAPVGMTKVVSSKLLDFNNPKDFAKIQKTLGKDATEFEVAQKIAQKNAALPLEEGGLGLPKNNTSADRAKAMGFETPVYHGTNADINAFNVEGKGKTSGAGAFVTTNPTAAETYVSGSGDGNILPLLMRKEDFLTTNARGRNWADIWTNQLGAKSKGKRYTLEELGLDINSATSTDELGMIAKELGLSGAEIKNVRDLGPNSHVMRAKQYLQEKYGITPDTSWSNITGEQFAEAQDFMKKFYESQKADIYALQDPSLLRSRFAAFDPARKGETGILAGMLPFGLLYKDEDK